MLIVRMEEATYLANQLFAPRLAYVQCALPFADRLLPCGYDLLTTIQLVGLDLHTSPRVALLAFHIKGEHTHG